MVTDADVISTARLHPPTSDMPDGELDRGTWIPGQYRLHITNNCCFSPILNLVTF